MECTNTPDNFMVSMSQIGKGSVQQDIPSI